MAVLEHQPLLWAWFGVAGLLMVAFAAVKLFQRFRPSPEILKNSQRIRTWRLICLSVFLAMSCGVSGLGVLFCAASILAMKEFASLRFHGQEPRLAFGAMTAAAMLLYAFLLWRPEWIPFWTALAVGLCAVALGVFASTRSISDSFLCGLAFLFSAAGLSHVILLAKLPVSADASRHSGPGAVFFLLLMTSLNDVAQYLWGKGLGRRKVVPRISPNKTLAGLIGGTLTTASPVGRHRRGLHIDALAGERRGRVAHRNRRISGGYHRIGLQTKRGRQGQRSFAARPRRHARSG